MKNKYYKRNYLSRVIVRIDFASPIENFSNKLPKRIDSGALQDFPIKEPLTEKIYTKIKLSKNGSKIEEEKIIKIWVFHDRNKEKTLEISLGHMDILFEKYNTYQELKEIFVKQTGILIEEAKDIVIKRFGLRYINNINIIDNTSATEWGKYLNKKMLSIFDIPEKNDVVLRAFQNIVLKYNDIYLNFRYGMHNPDFPAAIKKKIFVLDYDAYYEGLLETKNIPEYMDRFHVIIYKLFEYCITDQLREKMGVK